MKIDYQPQGMAQISGAFNMKDFIKNSADRFKNNNTGDVISGLSQLAAANALSQMFAAQQASNNMNAVSAYLSPLNVIGTGGNNTPYVNSALSYAGNNNTVPAYSYTNPIPTTNNNTIPQYSYF